MRRQTVRTRSHPGSGRWSSRSRIRQDGQTRAPPGPVAARRTGAHEVIGADTADAGRGTRGHRRENRTCTPGHWTADAWTSHTRTLTVTPYPWTSHARTLDGHTGHGRVDASEYADRATSARRASGQTSWTPRPPDCPLGRRTVDLWTAPAALGNDDDSATVRYLPARAYLPHHQAPARSLRRPSRALAHCSRVLDLDGTRGGQWDEGKLGCAGSGWLG
jgi:hypothetical protein